MIKAIIRRKKEIALYLSSVTLIAVATLFGLYWVLTKVAIHFLDIIVSLVP